MIPSVVVRRRTSFRRRWLAAVPLLVIVAHAWGDGRKAVPARTAGPVLADGRLAETAWRAAEVNGGFHAWNAEGPASPRTRFRVLYDDRALYFGIECEEPEMGRVRAEATERDGRVYPDDHIEIFLQPGGDEYFHFMFNLLGTRFDAKGLPGAVTARWNGDWDVAVRRGGNSWTAEVAIYFHSLEIQPDVGDTWRLNVARGRHTGEKLELSTWSPVEGTFHQPERFGWLRPIEADLARYAYRIDPPVRSSRMREGILDTAFSFDVVNQTGAARDVRVEGWLRGPSGRFTVRTVMRTLEEGAVTRVRIEGFPVSERGEHTLFVLVGELPDRDARRLAEFRVPIDFIPLRIVMEEPSYRDSIYATQRLDSIRLRVVAALDGDAATRPRLLVSLRKGETPVAANEPVEMARESVELSLPCAGLDVGEYRIVARLLDEDGKSIAETERELRKLPPAPGSEVRVDRDLNLIVNGKPFFPLGWYGGGPLAGGDFPGVFNCSYTGLGLIADTDEAIRQLDLSRENGVMIMTTIFPNVKMFRKADLSEDDVEAIAANVRRLRDHPALLAWMMHDEPECGGPPAATMEAVYERVRREDPYHPCVIINNTPDGLFSYANSADIFWPDPYPRFRRGGGPVMPITRVSLFMDSSARATEDRKPRWLCPQAFEFAAFDWDRHPTLVEERCMCYLAINHGCKGILYFNYRAARHSPELFLGIPFLAKEIRALGPVFLRGRREAVEAEPGELDVARWDLEDRTVIVAVNTTGTALTGVIPFPASVGVRAFSEDRAPKTVDGRIKDTFGPYETHIYVTGAGDDSRRTLEEVYREIRRYEAKLRRPGNVAFGASVRTSAGGRSDHHAAYVTDGLADTPGKLSTYGWSPGASSAMPAWVELNLDGEQRIARVVVHQSGLRAYAVQVRTEAGWETVSDGLGRHAVETHSFAVVRASRVRLYVTAAAPGAVVSEVEAYGE